jgi:hypothetical protein
MRSIHILLVNPLAASPLRFYLAHNTLFGSAPHCWPDDNLTLQAILRIAAATYTAATSKQG